MSKPKPGVEALADPLLTLARPGAATILRYLLVNRRASVYVRDVIRMFGLGSATAQRALRDLTAAGLLTKTRSTLVGEGAGRGGAHIVNYRLTETGPLGEVRFQNKLVSVVTRLSPPSTMLEAALAEFAEIKVAFCSGEASTLMPNEFSVWVIGEGMDQDAVALLLDGVARLYEATCTYWIGSADDWKSGLAERDPAVRAALAQRLVVCRGSLAAAPGTASHGGRGIRA